MSNMRVKVALTHLFILFYNHINIFEIPKNHQMMKIFYG